MCFEWSRARRLVAVVPLLSRCFVCFFVTMAVAFETRRAKLSVASGRKALGIPRTWRAPATRIDYSYFQDLVHKAFQSRRATAAMIDLAPLGYVLYATAALAFIWLLQNAAQL